MPKTNKLLQPEEHASRARWWSGLTGGHFPAEKVWVERSNVDSITCFKTQNVILIYSKTNPITGAKSVLFLRLHQEVHSAQLRQDEGEICTNLSHNINHNMF